MSAGSAWQGTGGLALLKLGQAAVMGVVRFTASTMPGKFMGVAPG